MDDVGREYLAQMARYEVAVMDVSTMVAEYMDGRLQKGWASYSLRSALAEGAEKVDKDSG